MIKVYYLSVERVGNTDVVKGSGYISHAICETTEKPNVRRVIIEENANLATLALKVEDPTQRDIDNYNSLLVPGLPPRNLAAEIDDLKIRVTKLEKP